MTAGFPLAWTPRPAPLRPAGVVAAGPPARALAAALLRRESLSGLSGVAGVGVLVVCGEMLPWCEGVTYVGPCPQARGLWLPTTLSPGAHPALLERALLSLAGAGAAPLAVTPERWVPLGGALPLDRGLLSAWLEGAGA